MQHVFTHRDDDIDWGWGGGLVVGGCICIRFFCSIRSNMQDVNNVLTGLKGEMEMSVEHYDNDEHYLM